MIMASNRFCTRQPCSLASLASDSSIPAFSLSTAAWRRWRSWTVMPIPVVGVSNWEYHASASMLWDGSRPLRSVMVITKFGVDAADGALGHGLADVRAAAGQRAVVARTRAGDLAARTRLVGGRLARDRRRSPVADVHEPFFGQHQERMPDSSPFQPLKPGELGPRREGVT